MVAEIPTFVTDINGHIAEHSCVCISAQTNVVIKEVVTEQGFEGVCFVQTMQGFVALSLHVMVGRVRALDRIAQHREQRCCTPLMHPSKVLRQLTQTLRAQNPLTAAGGRACRPRVVAIEVSNSVP